VELRKGVFSILYSSVSNKEGILSSMINLCL